MATSRSFSVQLLSLALALIVERSIAAEPRDQEHIIYKRRVTFELTFANRDLIWLGDAASPTATVYPKPGARPIATDVRVSAIIEDRESPPRRYFRAARIALQDGVRNVYAFTSEREKLIGTIDDRGHFSPNNFYQNKRELLPTWPADAAVLAYDENANALYCNVEVPGPVVTETLDFLPLELLDADGQVLIGRFSIDYELVKGSGPGAKDAVVALTLQNQGQPVTLAEARVPGFFQRGDVLLDSFDNGSGTYLSEAAYRAGASDRDGANPSVTVAVDGKFTSVVQADGNVLVVDVRQPAGANDAAPARIIIDGNFDDWRNVDGVDDPRGDLVPYLEYVPDVDLLEFKVAHDEQHIYLYARVAGQVGRSHPDGGRSYFYAYMDVDQNPGTGFLPTRDDDCYFGVDIGDDCEVQFEFVDNAFRKSFYGFCGLGGNDNVLRQQVTIGKSQYGRFDEQGNERENYKAEYIYRDGITEITEDLQLGTSDTIRLAISSDGSEVEVVSAFTGFLNDSAGSPTVKLGQTIDLAAGMECDSKAYIGKSRWAADSTVAIREYRLSRAEDRTTLRPSERKTAGNEVDSQ